MIRARAVLAAAGVLACVAIGARALPAAFLLRPALGGIVPPERYGFTRTGASGVPPAGSAWTVVEARLRARLLSQTGDFRAATDVLQGRDAASETDRALLAEAAADPAGAAVHWSAAGFDVPVAQRLATHAAVLGQQDAARAWTTRMLHLTASTADDALMQARAWRQRGDLTAAQAAVDRATVLGVAPRDGLAETSAILRAQGRWDAARNALSRALAASPTPRTGDSDLAYAEGRLCAYELRPADAGCALQRFRDAVARDDFAGPDAARNRADAWFQLGHQWMARREFAAARDSYLAAARTVASGSHFVSLALSEWLLGDRDQAMTHVDAAARARPAEEPQAAWRTIAEYCEGLGMTDAARAAREQEALAR